MAPRDDGIIHRRVATRATPTIERERDDVGRARARRVRSRATASRRRTARTLAVHEDFFVCSENDVSRRARSLAGRRDARDGAVTGG